jgi:hypothetical protein
MMKYIKGRRYSMTTQGIVVCDFAVFALSGSQAQEIDAARSIERPVTGPLSGSLLTGDESMSRIDGPLAFQKIAELHFSDRRLRSRYSAHLSVKIAIAMRIIDVFDVSRTVNILADSISELNSNVISPKLARQI